MNLDEGRTDKHCCSHQNILRLSVQGAVESNKENDPDQKTPSRKREAQKEAQKEEEQAKRTCI